MMEKLEVVEKKSKDDDYEFVDDDYFYD